MPLVLKSSLEHRIIAFASEHYPLTVVELAGALGVSVDKVMMELRRMESKGLAELEVLPDKVFVRLMVVFGEISRDGEKQKKEKKGGDDPAYL
jgi:DNA-binding MarR family transcriptional regulator